MKRVAVIIIWCALLFGASFGQTTSSVQEQENVVSITFGESCVALERGQSDRLQCDQGLASTISLRMSPGESTTLDLFAFYPEGTSYKPTDTSTSTDSTTFGALSGQTPSTTASGRIMQIKIEQSELVAGYNMQAVGDPVPFFIACHYSAAYERTLDIDPTARPEGRAHFFYDDGSDAGFYSTVRVRTLFASGRESAPNNSPQGQTIADQRNQIIDWGGRSKPYEMLPAEFGPEVACRGIAQAGISLGSTSNDGDSVFAGATYFSAPFVAATGLEEPKKPGIYSGDTNVCCSSMTGEAGSDFLGIGLDVDPTYCIERSIDCSPAMQFTGSTMRPKKVKLYGYDANSMQPIKYDDDDDDDSYVLSTQSDDSNDDDDEHGSRGGGACDVLQDMKDNISSLDIDEDQLFAIANRDCDCSFPSGTTASTASYSNCVFLCGTSDDDGCTTSLIDINLSTLNGVTSGRKGGPVFVPDDDSDAEPGVFEQGFSCNTGNSGARGYCPDWCEVTYAQKFLGAGSTADTDIGDPTARHMAGTLPWMVPVPLCSDDGGELDDIDNMGIRMDDLDCIANCANGLYGPDCDPVETCVDLNRLPGEDDCRDPDGTGFTRLSLATGPYVVAQKFVVPVGLDPYLFGLWPNAGGTWFSNTPKGIREIASASNTFGDTTDGLYAKGIGIMDQTDTVADGSEQLGTYVSVTPPSFCIVPISQQPGGAEYFTAIGNTDAVPAKFLCPDELFGGLTDSDREEVIRQACNHPSPEASRDLFGGGSGVDYTQTPFYICPTGHVDRVGLQSLDHLQYTLSADQISSLQDDDDADDDNGWGARIAAHKTADAIAHVGPYGKRFKVDKKPFLIYKQDVTIIDPFGPTGSRFETITVSSYNDPEATTPSGRVAFSSDSAIAVSLGDAKQADALGNALGTDMDLSIVIFNATDSGPPGTIDHPFRMAGPVSVTDAAFSEFYAGVEDASSTFWESRLITDSGQIPFTSKNSDFVLIPPLPQFYHSLPGAYDPREEDPDPENSQRTIRYGSFPMFFEGRSQAVLHSGWRGISQPVDFMGNSANARRVGASGACASVIGYREGVDKQWTSFMREYDSGFRFVEDDRRYTRMKVVGKKKNNGGVVERAIREELGPEVSPAVQTGRIVDALTLSSGNNAVKYLRRFGLIPDGYYEDCGAGSDGIVKTTMDGRPKCSLPTQIIQGDVFLYKDPRLAGSDVSVFSEIQVSDALALGTDQTLESGEFVDNPKPICSAPANGQTGHLTISARNLGVSESEFEVSAVCGSNVTPGASQIKSIKGGSVAQFTVVLAHSGPVIDTYDVFSGNGTATGNSTSTTNTLSYYSNSVLFECTVTLGSPLSSRIVWETATLDNCVLTGAGGDGDVTDYMPDGIEQCAIDGSGCPGTGAFAGATGTGGGDQDYFWTAVLLLVILLVILCLVQTCTCYMASRQYEKASRAKLESETQ